MTTRQGLWVREKRFQRRAEGQCRDCGVNSFTCRCPDCAEKHNAQNRAWRQKQAKRRRPVKRVVNAKPTQIPRGFVTIK